MAAPIPAAAFTAELLRHATELPVKVAQACTKAAYDTSARAKMPGRVPRDTGYLAASITVEPATPSNPVAEVGPEAHYGLFVEEGTVNMPEQPFMAPSQDEVTPSFVKAMGDAGVPDFGSMRGGGASAGFR